MIPGRASPARSEGWFSNPDGSYSILVGYYNRNLKQEVDLPVGPNNRIEPGGPDQGQPTHFLPGRQWGMFTIKEPKDFAGKRLTWTIVANGKPTSIPLDVDTLWEVSPFIEASQNTPPYIGFSESGPFCERPNRHLNLHYGRHRHRNPDHRMGGRRCQTASGSPETRPPPPASPGRCIAVRAA